MVFYMIHIGYLYNLPSGPRCQRTEAFSNKRIHLQNEFLAEIELIQNLITFTANHQTLISQSFSTAVSVI